MENDATSEKILYPCFGRSSYAFTRMSGTAKKGGPDLSFLSGWRSLVATAAAVAVGVANVARGGDDGTVELKPGDDAPDFTLPGSDGRSYHVRDFRGTRGVVIAWFPKAFTGG